MLMKTSASFRDEDAVQLLVGCALGIAAHALVAWLAAVVGLFLMTDAPGKLSNHLGSIFSDRGIVSTKVLLGAMAIGAVSGGRIGRIEGP